MRFLISKQANKQSRSLWIMVDSINFFTFLNLTVRMIRFINLAVNTMCFTSHLIYKQLNQFLKLQTDKLHENKFFTQVQLARKLNVFQREHHRITSMLIFANRTLFDKTLLSILLANHSFNIITLTLLILKKFSRTSKDFMLFTLIFESFGFLSLVSVIAFSNSNIYSCKKYLVVLQSGLGIYQLRDKIHHQRFYELVNFKYDIGISVGIIGVLTKQKLYEVCATSG